LTTFESLACPPRAGLASRLELLFANRLVVEDVLD
jgi:hypothetical protein